MAFSDLFGKKKSSGWENLVDIVQKGIGALMHRTENKVMSTIQMIEQRMISKIDQIKRHIMRSILEIMFYMISAVTFIIGIVILLGKLIPYEWVFIGVAVITLWAAIIIGSVKN